MKKHFSQMTRKEVNYFVNKFKSIPQNHWKFTSYSKMRVLSRKVDMTIFRTFWTDGFDLIEFHQYTNTFGRKENRILIRTVVTDKNDYQVCAVFNFTTMEITTVYLNYRKNKHHTLDWKEYDSSIDVKYLMKLAQ